ncbi:MAG: ABC transporter ATP-binding protein [Candidatus Saccharibacteria bacterium]
MHSQKLHTSLKRTPRFSKVKISPSDEAFLVIKNLKKKDEHQKKNILNEINIAIEQGEIVAITGKENSGKSLILKIIAGLLKEDGGSIEIDDEIITDFSLKERNEYFKKNIGFLSYPIFLKENLSVIDNILIPNYFLKSYVDIEEDRLKSLLDAFDLTDLINQKATNLTSDQKRKINVVRALINEPKLILCDEPMLENEDGVFENIMKNFRIARDEFGATVIVATKDYNFAKLADQVIYLEDGKVRY